MVRVLAAIKGALLLAVALRIHHRFHGPPVDYVGLAAAAAASWAGVPGPGEPVLVAEAIFASKHDLDIWSVIVVAWLGASAGGLLGWGIGRGAGRTIVTAPGFLHALRLKAVRRGEDVFARFPVLAILFTPSWVAGIHRVRPAVYVPVNELGAAAWAIGIGLGGYLLGPPIVDLVGDLGVVAVAGLCVLIAVTVGGEALRRRRSRTRPRT